MDLIESIHHTKLINTTSTYMIESNPDSRVHGAHLGPTGPRWAPCWPHELCYPGRFFFPFHQNKRNMYLMYFVIVHILALQCKFI